MTQVVAVTPSIPAPVALGCGEPRAEVWTRGLDNRVIELPEIVAASYGYMLADTSLGEVTMDAAVAANDPRCSALGAVLPWVHELVIYRDGVLAWSGPITEIEHGDDAFTLKARDLSAWLDHRVVHTTHIYGGQGPGQGTTDTTVIFAALITDAMAPDTSPNLALSAGQVSGVLAQGNYTPGSFQLVGPLIRDLAKGSIDWYVIDRVLHYTGGGASAPAPPGGSPVDVTGASFANPGFETNTAGWSVTGGTPTITRDTAQFHAGAASGRLNKGTAPTFRADYASVNNLIVGKSYTVKGWFRGSPAFSGFVESNVTLLKMSIAGVYSADISYQVFIGTPSTWVQTSVTFTAAATSYGLRVDYHDPSYGAVTANLWMDDFTVTLNNPDVPPPPPPPPSDPLTTLPLSDDDLARPPKITLAGLNQETRSIVSNQQAGGDVAFYGEAPAPGWTLNTNGPGLTAEQTEYGLLEGSGTSTLADAAGAQAQASQRSTLLSETPVVLDGFVLSKDARVSFDHLLPGVLIELRIDRPCLSVEQTLVIRQVQVKATPQNEEITLILEPSGVE